MDLQAPVSLDLGIEIAVVLSGWLERKRTNA